jgi:hypothetical protein
LHNNFRKLILAFVLVFNCLVFSACNSVSQETINAPNASELSDEQLGNIAKEYFLDLNQKKINIVSIERKDGLYLVKWDYSQNCEEGTLYVDKSGKLIKGEASIC